MSNLPFETLILPVEDADTFVSSFARPGHVALIVGPWVAAEFSEYVDTFIEPTEIITSARRVNVKQWIAERAASEDQVGQAFSGIFQAIFGAQPSMDDPDASDAEKYIRAARASFHPEDTEKSAYVSALEDILNDAADIMRSPGDQLQYAMSVAERLQNLNATDRPLDETMQGLQTIGQFFMGEQVAKMTGMDEMMAAFADPAGSPKGAFQEVPQRDVGATIVAVLPVDEAWAALAWMQHGDYAQGDLPALVAIARDLEQSIGARAVSATCDSIRFQLPKPAEDADAIVTAFSALGATTINEVDLAHSASQLSSATEWRVWWD